MAIHDGIAKIITMRCSQGTLQSLVGGEDTIAVKAEVGQSRYQNFPLLLLALKSVHLGCVMGLSALTGSEIE
ncbi:MAG TPA: hypothetical protein EYP10_12245 [Armatimonadetes bacterium]|nr:hypothetical protein [Armatimonadota bacterium]